MSRCFVFHFCLFLLTMCLKYKFVEEMTKIIAEKQILYSRFLGISSHILQIKTTTTKRITARFDLLQFFLTRLPVVDFMYFSSVYFHIFSLRSSFRKCSNSSYLLDVTSSTLILQFKLHWHAIIVFVLPRI